MKRIAPLLWLAALLLLAQPVLFGVPGALANDPPSAILTVDDDEFASAADVMSSSYTVSWGEGAGGAYRVFFAIPADGTAAYPSIVINGEPYALNGATNVTEGTCWTGELILSHGDVINFRQSQTTRSTWRVQEVQKGL